MLFQNDVGTGKMLLSNCAPRGVLNSKELFSLSVFWLLKEQLTVVEIV